MLFLDIPSTYIYLFTYTWWFFKIDHQLIFFNIRIYKTNTIWKVIGLLKGPKIHITHVYYLAMFLCVLDYVNLNY